MDSSWLSWDFQLQNCAETAFLADEVLPPSSEALTLLFLNSVTVFPEVITLQDTADPP